MTDTSSSPNSVEVFFSYSHKDEDLRDELETHLAMLKREGTIKSWHDRKISAGREWAGEIDQNLNSARLILLLISANFLASEYCYDIELKQAMKRHEAGEARVVPIILKPVDWNSALFGKLQALPKNAKPVTTWTDRDEAFLNITQGIRRTVQELMASSESAVKQKVSVATENLGDRPSIPSMESPREKQRRQLQDDYDLLSREYQQLNQEANNALDGVTANKLRRKAESILQDMTAMYQKIQELAN
jgi:TIR domain/Effector-associated domain 9